MRTVAIVQSRLGSTRFPRKALADLNGHPMIWHVVQRAKQIPGVDKVVLAVPVADYDEMSDAVEECGVSVYGHRGVESDVLRRFLTAMRRFRATTIMRITGDCPALNPGVAGRVLCLFRAAFVDFASNDTRISGYPDGWDVEVFSRSALETAAANATEPFDLEHVTPWMQRHLDCVTLRAPEPWTGPKLSVDVPSDLEVVRAWLAGQRA